MAGFTFSILKADKPQIIGKDVYIEYVDEEGERVEFDIHLIAHCRLLPPFHYRDYKCC